MGTLNFPPADIRIQGRIFHLDDQRHPITMWFPIFKQRTQLSAAKLLTLENPPVTLIRIATAA